MTRGFRLGVGDSSVACGVAPRGDRATKNPRLAERGLFVPPKVSASNLAPFIGGAAAKVNLESVLSGAMALGLAGPTKGGPHDHRSEEHTSELQSLMRISYAVFCLKKQKIQHKT